MSVLFSDIGFCRLGTVPGWPPHDPAAVHYFCCHCHALRFIRIDRVKRSLADHQRVEKEMKILYAIWVLLVIGFVGGSLSPARADTSGLVGHLTKQLGVTEEQATGGSGSVFALAKSKLSPSDFSQVAGVVPEMDSLLGAAPKAESKGGGAGTAASGASSMMGSGGSGLGGLASLAGPFSQLGLSPDMIGKFVPSILEFVGGKGGSSVQSLLAGVLK
jgi:hypothetical protein